MKGSKLLMGCLVCVLILPGVGLADPWKDESGHGRGYHRDERRDGRWDRDRRDWQDHRRGGERRSDHRGYYSPYAQPRIPPGQLPPLGEYRAWYPDRPAGHQPPPLRW